jgi:hypothetical protein
MAVLHLVDFPTLTGLLAVITAAVLGGIRLWVWLRSFVILERARTRRMSIALRGASGPERADIIRACAALEAAARPGRRDNDVPRPAA